MVRKTAIAVNFLAVHTCAALAICVATPQAKCAFIRTLITA
jgi:hypothetical protein